MVPHFFVPTNDKKRITKRPPNSLSLKMIGKENSAAAQFSILGQEWEGKLGSHRIFLLT